MSSLCVCVLPDTLLHVDDLYVTCRDGTLAEPFALSGARLAAPVMVVPFKVCQEASLL
jgi:hypothetical protein